MKHRALITARLMKLPGFTHDGCTGVPDGNPGIEMCCMEHDAYYQYKRDVLHDLPVDECPPITRREADRRLRRCIEGSGAPIWARIIFLGVRTFGVGYWNGVKSFSDSEG